MQLSLYYEFAAADPHAPLAARILSGTILFSPSPETHAGSAG